jgi:hypothetical protein
MIIYKISGYRNPFDNVGRYLARESFSYIKDLLVNKKIKVGFGYTFTLSFFAEDIKRNVIIIMYINYVDEFYKNIFSVDSEYIYKRAPNRKNDINLTINIYNNFSKDYFIDLKQKLIDKFRHEMEHWVQDESIEGGMPVTDYSKDKLNSVDDIEGFRERIIYVKNQFERDAFIRANMLRAKNTRQPFEKILNSFIDYQLFKSDASVVKNIRDQLGEEVDVILEDLKNIYMSRAKSIFPNLNKQ